MRLNFSLEDSPFRNFLKFSMEEVSSYLAPHLHLLVQKSYDETGMPIPPGAFIFSDTKGSYFSCYDYESPSSFISILKEEIDLMLASRSVVFSSVGSLVGGRGARYLLVDVQSSWEHVRFALDLENKEAIYPATSGWNVILPDALYPSQGHNLEEESDLVLDAEHQSCIVSGTEMFAPLFPLLPYVEEKVPLRNPQKQ